MEVLRTLIGPDDGDATVGQLCVRAVILLLVGIAYIRIAGRRTFSQASPLDIVVALVVGSNLSRAMTGKAPFWPALAATLLLVILHRVFAMATLRWAWLAKLMKAEAVVLVRDGQPDRRAMAWHGVGDNDLLEALRLEQTRRLEDVQLATLENSGRISVIRVEPQTAPHPPTVLQPHHPPEDRHVQS